MSNLIRNAFPRVNVEKNCSGGAFFFKLDDLFLRSLPTSDNSSCPRLPSGKHCNSSTIIYHRLNYVIFFSCILYVLMFPDCSSLLENFYTS